MLTQIDPLQVGAGARRPCATLPPRKDCGKASPLVGHIGSLDKRRMLMCDRKRLRRYCIAPKTFAMQQSAPKGGIQKCSVPH
jgi:hypothetical protein